VSSDPDRQAAYYAATGAAPFVSRRAFEAVTGPKADWWLVQTVGLLSVAIGTTLALASRRGRLTPELRLLAGASAASFLAVDVVHVARARLRWTYLIDAAAQAWFLRAAGRWDTAG
jgi:hypothetical protein